MMVQDESELIQLIPVPRALLSWSDRGVAGRHHGPRPATDRGPVLRLLEQDESRYDAALLLSVTDGRAGAESLAADLGRHVPAVEVRALAVDDPSDYRQLFRALGKVTPQLDKRWPRPAWQIDVLLSAGTPQAQTLWVILVQAGVLHARMLQIIPAVFVPVPHPKAVREVRLDIEGFPEIRALREEVTRLRAESRTRALVGTSQPMRDLGARVARVAATDVPVLIVGETGSGKELVARALHDAGARATGPFVAENCGAFAEGVLLSELFGHEPGAFTGAVGRRRGLFEQAHGGTLFLDEIGELSGRAQSTLLRVLQEGALRRVGGERQVRVDVRVIAATHRDLPAMVRAGTFREDLFYRLRGATLELPPLRARVGDVPLLVDVFLDEARGARRHRLTVTAAAMRALNRYAWPGNVRELRAEVMRWAVFCDDEVGVGDLAPEIRGQPIGAAPIGGDAGRAAPAVRALVPLREAVAAAERGAIVAALEACGHNLTRAARALGVDRNLLKRRIRAYRLRD
jgi:DNA-binding NtrC family response regulator